MRLYYFTNKKYGLAAIHDSRLKIARIGELNDPFEFLGLNLERKDRKVMSHWKKEMDANFGIICMSVNWMHPLLWSHYADKHKGMALGFDVVEEGTFTKVKYERTRPTLDDIGLTSLDNLREDEMKKRLLFSKFEAWSYETEYRGFCRLDEKCSSTGHFFLPFSDNMKLAEVIVGHGSSVTRATLAKALGDRAKTVRKFKARPGFKKFEVVENTKHAAWK